MTKKRLGIILLIAALLGFAIYEKALETQVDQQYRIESNMPEWDGQTAVLKGTLKYNDFRIGTMRFSGSVRIGEHELEYLDGLPLDYPDRRDAGAVCPTRFYMDRGTGQDIPPLFNTEVISCDYHSKNGKIRLGGCTMDNEQVELWLIPIEEGTQ